jgi:hypothetical protein
MPLELGVLFQIPLPCLLDEGKQVGKAVIAFYSEKTPLPSVPGRLFNPSAYDFGNHDLLPLKKKGAGTLPAPVTVIGCYLDLPPLHPCLL